MENQINDKTNFSQNVVHARQSVQTMTGVRPSELCKMTVGDIDKSDPDGWVYVLKDHKTARKTGKKSIVFGKEEQKLIAPYLEGKKSDNAVLAHKRHCRQRGVR